MTSLPRFSVKNPVLVNLVMVALLIGGAYSLATLVREMFPESQPTKILISTAYPGATPAEVEKGITLKIEEQVKDVDGVEKLTSEISEGRSTILLELESGFDQIEQAINEVEAAIDAIPAKDFPEDALETHVIEFEPMLPVIMVSLYGDVDDRVLKTLGERLRDELRALPEVSDVDLSGTRKDEISVEVRPEKLIQFGLSFMDVAAAISNSNLDLPGGRLRTGDAEVSVRTLGEKDRGRELYDIVVKSDSIGRVVTLADVATIVDAFEDAEVSSRFNGRPSISLTVSKSEGQDAIAIAARVRAVVSAKMGQPLDRPWFDRLWARVSGNDLLGDIYETARSSPLPPGVSIGIHNDLSRFISGRLELLTRNGLWGLLFVFLSLLTFLHWRIAFWVMMGLILSIAGTIVFMKLAGQSLNLITMFGLIIVLGLLVDDAIIVSEHVYSKVEAGMEPELAAIKGAEEVAWPVVCAILTTIVAFVPLMGIEGQMGQWMGALPVIVCLALSVSLFESLSILPSHLAHNLGAIVPKRAANEVRRPGALGRIKRLVGNGAWLVWLRGKYERFLRLAVRFRYVTMSALVGIMFMVIGAVLGGHVPYVFIQEIDSEALIVNMKMGVGTPAAVTREAMRAVERVAMAMPETRSVSTLVGRQVSLQGSVDTLQPHIGQAFIELADSDSRDRISDDILVELREKTADLHGVEKLKFSSMNGGPGGAAIDLAISGDRVSDLVAISEELRAELAEFKGVYDIVDDYDPGRPEMQIELFQSARVLGLTTQSLATQIRSAFYGFEAGKVQRGREDVRIMVRYPLSNRRMLFDLESMRIATPSGAMVPLIEVARLTEGTGEASIKRTDQRRTVTVTAAVDSKTTNSSRIIAAIADRFPEFRRRYPGVQLSFGGQRLETAKSFGSLKQGFVIALLLIFVILAGLFGSYIQPLIVMAVIPFGLIGAVAGHYALGYPLTILSIIGTVALTGIVVNDSMILVVFINRRIAEGGSPYEAVIEAGKSRLRPILLTSLTTVLGVAPLLMETSFQAQFLIPMGVSISAGLVFATVLTLVAVPSTYLIVLDIKEAFARAVAWLMGREPSPEGGTA